MKFSINRFKTLLLRNRYSREGKQVHKGTVNLEWYRDDTNLGDFLSKVVVGYMLSEKGISETTQSIDGKTKHLMAIGSILGGSGEFDATVWGSGVRNFSSVKGLCIKKFYQKLDIRAVRGPFTRDALVQCGIDCPRVYGDPAVLMPMIYKPTVKDNRGTVLILHYLTSNAEYQSLDNITLLDIKTTDYKSFIDVIASATKVISSSLHGIILAETYGVHAVFLQKGIESETLKFYDWYYSTGRRSVVIASSLEEAVEIEPMCLPDLKTMQQQLIETFPYDLWK